MSIHDLPAVNASLNGLSAIFLTLGFVFIKRGNKTAHRNCMISAFATSIIFLGCYLTYHGYLAIVIVPLILVTLWRAKKKRFELHKKIARWTWPLWMYVSVTGVVVYWLLYIKYPQ